MINKNRRGIRFSLTTNKGYKMFATISTINLTVDSVKYLIAIGYDLPDDKKIEEITEQPDLSFTIQKVLDDDKYETFVKPDEDSEEYQAWARLKTTAQIYTRGFIDGVGYYSNVTKTVENQEKDSIITE